MNGIAMADQPPERSQDAESGLPSKPSAASTQNGQSRTAAAGRALLQAARADIAALFHRADRTIRSALRERGRSDGAASRRRRRFVWRFVAATGALAALAIVIFTGFLLWAVRDLPVESAVAEDPARTVILEASDGSALGRLGALKAADAPLDELPENLVLAVLSIEDQRFFSHPGVDPYGIVRALRRNIAAGTVVEGGSTIAQQLVKLRLVGNEQSYTRKLREALAAIWIDMRFTKQEILTSYLNTVYLGAGAYGMPAAAKAYFDKEPSELTLSEAAMLAGLIKAPSRYNPLQDPAAARGRAAVVLDAMVDRGVISAEQAERAKAQPLSLNRPEATAPAGSWFADWVGREAIDLIGSFRGGVRVRTTLVPELQRVAEEIVQQFLVENADLDVSQASLVAMRRDGAVLAMVGGRDYNKSQFNRAVQAKRQPGSAFKLFVYMAALRDGYHLGDVIDARAQEIDGWRPENFGGAQYGRVTLAEAFAKSINTATVNLALKVGMDRVVSAARELGLDAPLEELPSIALGSKEVSLLDLTAAYASVLAGRAPVEPWGILALAPQSQQRLMSVEAPVQGRRSLGPLRERLLKLLELPVTQGTAQNAALNEFVAGKTGTSQEHRDAWFIGFNDALVVGIWVGNDDSRPMQGVVGGTVAAKIWKRFMVEAGVTEGGANRHLLKPPMAADQIAASEQRPPRPEERQSPAEAPWAILKEQTAERSAVADDSTGQQIDRSSFQAVCDVRACQRAYRSFRASDCTYQPYGGGPRVRCDKGDAQGPASLSVVERALQGQCNLQLCSQIYNSFRPSDCTYQPYGGGQRQICDK